MGDPAGVGPELCARAATAHEFKDVEFRFYGTQGVLDEAFRRFGAGAPPPEAAFDSGLTFADVPVGKADARCGKSAYDALTAATEDVRSGECAALVTAPMNKYSVNLAGIPFTGHTERIAELCGCSDFAMLQSTGGLRVIFATTHIPISEVSKQLTKERIVLVSKLLYEAIKEEGIAAPRLAAAALNPHAGENGCMGHEERDTVIPALEELRAAGVAIDGPYPPDVMFIERIRSKYDGLVAMYHDQGHIPVKMLAFDSCVNSTLGIPIIRTSPDHGTAFDIAWQGRADTGSFFAAIRLALRRAAHRG
jgi:4-hydroxythreonine-4-phosphate dehydrogenase